MISGQIIYLVAKAIVPTGNSNGDIDESTFTGTSVGDLTATPASDNAMISTTVIAPIITMTKYLQRD